MKWETVLYMIIENGHFGILQMILRYQLREWRLYVFKSALIMAFKLEKVKEILSFVAVLTNDEFYKILSITLKCITQLHDLYYAQQDDQRKNCLILAVLEGSKMCNDIVKFLLQRGAQVNFKSSEGFSPLVHAIRQGHEEMTEVLLNGGADVNAEKAKYLCFHRTNGKSRKKYFPVSKVLVRHVVDLQEAGEFVRDDHLQMIDGDEQLIGFKEICQVEIRLIKGKRFVDTSVTLYEVWKAREFARLVGYLKNQDIERFIKSRVFASKYPIYRDRMTMKFKRGFERIYLEKRVCNFFSSLSAREDDRLPKLPDTCVHKIINYLNDGDLINLRNSYY